jgi:predicted O-linked N-acetylglucosamine transferase (SPINDLY family)
MLLNWQRSSTLPLEQILQDFIDRRDAPSPEVIDRLLLSAKEAITTSTDVTENLRGLLLQAAIKLAYNFSNSFKASLLLSVYCNQHDNDLECLRHLSAMLTNAGLYKEAIAICDRCLQLDQSQIEWAFTFYHKLRCLLSGGMDWQQAQWMYRRLKDLLQKICDEGIPDQEEAACISRLYCCLFWFPYLEDNPQQTRPLQNQVMAEVAAALQKRRSPYSHSQNSSSSRLKLGFVGSSLHCHSVGWLSRWLVQHLDREQVDLSFHFVLPRHRDPLHQWFAQQGTAHYPQANAQDVAQSIYDDKLDILIDLDSLTLDITAEALTYKPAPVQVTWLGWDAAGNPAVDYFIADPFVLGASTQSLYREKVLMLPDTYIAVDGFEVNVPSTNRRTLGIPDDAVVFYSGQREFKFNPQLVAAQIAILQSVPGSYLIVKGLSEQSQLCQQYEAIAREQRVDISRLRFLSFLPNEQEGRGFLSLCDVALDTYPYNGATTTLETLWNCVPLISLRGTQFSSRTSFSALENVGCSDIGSASDLNNYIQRAITLGRGKGLRDRYRQRLWDARRTSPLWNTQKFAQDFTYLMRKIR